MLVDVTVPADVAVIGMVVTHVGSGEMYDADSKTKVVLAVPVDVFVVAYRNNSVERPTVGMLVKVADAGNVMGLELIGT